MNYKAYSLVTPTQVKKQNFANYPRSTSICAINPFSPPESHQDFYVIVITFFSSFIVLPPNSEFLNATM